MKFTTFYLTNVLVILTIVVMLLQCSAVTALTSAICAIPAPFPCRVMTSGPECHLKTHSFKIVVLLQTKQDKHDSNQYFFSVSHFYPGHVHFHFNSALLIPPWLSPLKLFICPFSLHQCASLQSICISTSPVNFFYFITFSYTIVCFFLLE